VLDRIEVDLNDNGVIDAGDMLIRGITVAPVGSDFIF
jgi:hypothetical protein